MKISVTSVNAVDGLNHWHFIGLATTNNEVEKLKSDWLVAYKADPSNPAWTEDGFFSEETREIDVHVDELKAVMERALNYANNVGMAEGCLFDSDKDVAFIESRYAELFGALPSWYEQSEKSLQIACRTVFAGVGACSPEIYTRKIEQIAKMTGRQCDDQLMSDVRDVLAGFPCPLD